MSIVYPMVRRREGCGTFSCDSRAYETSDMQIALPDNNVHQPYSGSARRMFSCWISGFLEHVFGWK